ncbi:MAG: uracil-DNA glycosylase, partial [Bdellovibrionota bacterium]
RQEAAKEIFPPAADIFNAFNLTPLSKVKVVILGQDPYHGPGQAHGLAFSVRKGVRPPPSLKNIFKELAADLGLPIPQTGDLTSWAKQGVLLLNTVLTVEKGQAASHRNKGWERFTDEVIRILSAQEHPIVFLLWGSFAHKKAEMIRTPPHKVLKAPHPSPLSAHTGYFGSHPFSQTNKILAANGAKEIDWRLEA